MLLTSRLQRWLAWWLLAVTLLGALAPTVSRARAAAQGQTGVTWMEVCTTQGMQRVAVDEPYAPAPPTVVVDHCPLCVLSLDRQAPPVDPFVWQGLSQAPPVFDRVHASTPLTTRPWAVQSRAPPVRS